MSDVAGTFLSDESGIRGEADRIVFVNSKEEIARIFADGGHWTIQGAQTGISGAAVPNGGGICNCSKWSGVLQTGMLEETYFIDVLPGTTLQELKKAIPRGWFFPVDPTEDSATIGGMFATNAAGPCAFYYGRMSDWVLESDVFFPSFGWMTVKRGECLFSAQGEVHLPDGACLKTEPVPDERYIEQLLPKAGMDLLELLAGSEGMLGVLGRIRLRLERQFQERWSIVCFFDGDKNAFAFSDGIGKLFEKNPDCHVLALDFLGEKSIANYRKYAGEITAYRDIPELSKDFSAVMAEFSSNEPQVIEELIGDLFAWIEECGGSDENTWAADTEEEREKIRKFRHAVSACINEKITENRSRCPAVTKLSVDAACGSRKPQDMFDCLEQMVKAAEHAVIIHMGTGIFHIDFFAKTQKEWRQAMEIRERIFDLFTEPGGTIAAENGVGKGKRSCLQRMISPGQKNTAEQVKGFFDRERQCNPGNGVCYRSEYK